MSTYTDQVEVSKIIGRADAAEFIDNFGIEYSRKWSHVLCGQDTADAVNGVSTASGYGYSYGFALGIVDYLTKEA